MVAAGAIETQTPRNTVAAALGVLRRARPTGTPGELLAMLADCQTLKSAVEAFEVLVATTLRQQRAAEAAAVKAQGGFEAFQQSRQIERGVVGEVALARHDSPAVTGRWLAMAETMVAEMPHTFEALTDGRLSPRRAQLLVGETRCLDPVDRAKVDVDVCADPGLAAMSDKAVAFEARRAAYRLDPRAVLARHRLAESERRASVRPVDDGMARFAVVTTLQKAVAMYAAVDRAADEARHLGDERTRGQLQADVAFARVTGLQSTDSPPVEVQLLMTDRTLLGLSDEPAEVLGHGPIPAPAVRWLLRGPDTPPGTSPESDECAQSVESAQSVDDEAAMPPGVAQAWIRRLWSDLDSGALVAMESRRSKFPIGLRRFVVARDLLCRTPWCGAPIRHTDHVVARADGGATDEANAQGLCERCNYLKQANLWRSCLGVGGAGRSVLLSQPGVGDVRSVPPRAPRGVPERTRARARAPAP